ncbi:MAG: hypothetical protein WBI12_08195 [Methanosarcina flavescens]|jgi:hypothetical protein
MEVLDHRRGAEFPYQTRLHSQSKTNHLLSFNPVRNNDISLYSQLFPPVPISTNMEPIPR